jgi:threonine/homoserine/homoserine lactone efflux protein
MPQNVSLLAGCAYVAAVMVVVNWPCIALWALFGSSLRAQLQRPARRLVFNIVMAVALAGTAVIMVI